MSGSISRRRFLRGGAAALVGSLFWSRAAFALEELLGGDGDWAIPREVLEGLPASMAEASVPGVSTALGPPGSEPFARGFGIAVAGLERAVEPATVFPAGSLSKPLLATIALELEGEGAFDLDRPLREWLTGTDFPAGPGAERLTARHALAHTTGLPNWRFDPQAPFELQAEPGARWGYSGEGYVLVQRAVEAASGRGYESLANELVFQPLAMTSSTFLWRADFSERIARPTIAPDAPMAAFADYGERRARALVAWAAREGIDPAGIRYEEAVATHAAVAEIAARQSDRPLPDVAALPIVLTPNAAGSLLTTGPDYLRFLHAWLVRDDWRERALGSPVAAGEGIGWGLGWGLELAVEGRPFWHWGEGVGYRSFALGDPRAGEAIVVLTNSDGGMDIARLVVDAATGASHPAFDFV
ncbi:MAG TPA: serine hydrolase domain-containing protein [Gemmatimonadota bacterium]|nr:serine hydrolase domain-containing protein [Gemmatimonadota bacterium]